MGMIGGSILNKLIYHLFCINRFDKALHRYQGFRSNSIINWKKQTDLNWFTISKLLKNLAIFDAAQIRQTISDIISENQSLFSAGDCYITSFGKLGKSGDMVLYDYTHAQKTVNPKVLSLWEISSLPSNSKIVFVDDLIGTGTQSLEYISEKLNLILSPSFETYLLCICATPEGMKNVESNSNFKVLCGNLLKKEKFQFYDDDCKVFTEREKEKIKLENAKLKNPDRKDFDRGLLTGFYYSMPNNAMPILWKGGYKYKDKKGKQLTWEALLPRYY